MGKCVFSLSNSSTLKNLLTPKDNMLNEINSETMNLFNPKDFFKIPPENLVKTATESYIKQLLVSFVNERYFLFNISNIIRGSGNSLF